MSAIEFIPLGGMGNVTQNMYLYRYDQEILIIDCGIGFPDSYMPGVDVLIPDISYLLRLLEQGNKIVGMVLSHGHDDHIAALPYLLPNLPDFPIYGSALTAAFATQRISDGKIRKNIEVIEGTQVFKLSSNFSFQLIPVTHSVPDTRHVVVHSPEGIIYHGSDFKLDPAPVDNQLTDVKTIAQFADQNVLCMMVDCLRVENDHWVESESTTGPAISQIMANTKGKCLVTLMSSHIHRIQQTVDAAQNYGRKVAFIGRSVEQNVEIALKLGLLKMQKGVHVDKRDLDQWPDEKICIIVAGSQGQEGSSLTRAIFGEHPILRITKKDTVIFSADAIPGNELAYFGAIDELSKNRIHVIYPDVSPEIHRSGHASAPEQQEIVGLVKPKLLMPIGGADRHRIKFVEKVAMHLGYSEDQVLLPESGQVLSISQNSVSVIETISLRPQIVDGLGIGDVGPVVLSDRRTLGQAGIVVVVVARNKGRFNLNHITVVSRGFVFMKEADEVIGFIQQQTAEVINKEIKGKQKVNDESLRRMIENRLARKLYKVIKREPMIVPVFIDL